MKARFLSAGDAQRIADCAAPLILSPSKGPLRPYHCDRCRQFHLTSRTKGKRMVRPWAVEPA
jgi:hypothetical protein